MAVAAGSPRRHRALLGFVRFSGVGTGTGSFGASAPGSHRLSLALDPPSRGPGQGPRQAPAEPALRLFGPISRTSPAGGDALARVGSAPCPA